MKTPKILFLLLALAVSASAEDAKESPFKTEEQKVLYTLGLVIGRNVAPFSLTLEDLKWVSMGFRDHVANEAPKADPNVYGPKIQELEQKRQALNAESEKKKAAAFLKQAAKEKGAQKLPSGLIYQELRPGTGPSPKDSDTVKAHYQGTLTDGTIFDSSYQRGSPTEFPVSGVIKCWIEGLQKMKVGGKSKLVCPSSIAYGDAGSPPAIPGGATLVFEVELMEIVKK